MNYLIQKSKQAKDIFHKLISDFVFLNFKPKFELISTTRNQKYVFLRKTSIVNNIFVLFKLRKTFFTEKDTRAGWIGSGLPFTKKREYQGLVKMALQHLYMYVSFLNQIKKSKGAILDVGCGMGYATICIADTWKNTKVIGLDYDSEAIKFAKKVNSLDNIEYLSKNFASYKTRKRFDYIFLIDVLEHVKADLHFKVIDKCLDLLKNDGFLFLATPNAVNEEDGEHSHVGLLNKKRMQNFIKRYKGKFVEESFIIDNLLAGGKMKKFVKFSSLALFEKFQNKNKTNYTSHIRVIMKK